MFFVPAAGAIGILVGLVAALIGRRGISEVADYLFFLRLRMPSALAAGVVLGIPIWLNLDVPAANYIAAVSLLAITYGAAINYGVTGMWIVALGTGMNLVVYLANGAIPVDAGALAAAGVLDGATIDQVVFGTGRQLATDGDYLGWLGAVIGVRALGEAITFGDLVTAAGLANVTFRLVWPRGSSLLRVLPPPVEMPADELADYASDLARPHGDPEPSDGPADGPAGAPTGVPAGGSAGVPAGVPATIQPVAEPPSPPPPNPLPHLDEPVHIQPSLSYIPTLDGQPNTEQLIPTNPPPTSAPPTSAPSAAQPTSPESAAPAPSAQNADERTQLIHTTGGTDAEEAPGAPGSASHSTG